MSLSTVVSFELIARRGQLKGHMQRPGVCGLPRKQTCTALIQCTERCHGGSTLQSKAVTVRDADALFLHVAPQLVQWK